MLGLGLGWGEGSFQTLGTHRCGVYGMVLEYKVSKISCVPDKTESPEDGSGRIDPRVEVTACHSCDQGYTGNEKMTVEFVFEGFDCILIISQCTLDPDYTVHSCSRTVTKGDCGYT